MPTFINWINTNATTTINWINLTAPNATPTPLRGSIMPTARDARGRFASSREKTPVTTVDEAAETLRHFTTVMNEVATANRLCSQFGISVTRAVADTPGVKFENPNVPEFSMHYSIQGRILTPAGADIVGPNRDVRREHATTFLREEFRTWAREHDLDPRKGSSFLAWADTLPAERRTATIPDHVLGETGTSQFADIAEGAVRVVTFALPGDPVPPPPPGLDRADPVIRPFQLGDHVIRVSELHTIRGGTHDYAQESDRGMTGVVSRVGDGDNVQVAWDTPKSTPTSRIDTACLRHLLPAPAVEPGKAPDDTPEPERPEEQTFEIGDRVLVLPSASEPGSETDRQFSSAFNRRHRQPGVDLIAEVERRIRDGYEVRAVSGYPNATTQAVATADLRPHVDAAHELDRLTPVPF